VLRQQRKTTNLKRRTTRSMRAYNLNHNHESSSRSSSLEVLIIVTLILIRGGGGGGGRGQENAPSCSARARWRGSKQKPSQTITLTPHTITMTLIGFLIPGHTPISDPDVNIVGLVQGSCCEEWRGWCETWLCRARSRGVL